MTYTYTRHYVLRFVTWKTIAAETIKDIAYLHSLDNRDSWQYTDTTDKYHYQRTYIFDNPDDYAAFVLARG